MQIVNKYTSFVVGVCVESLTISNKVRSERLIITQFQKFTNYYYLTVILKLIINKTIQQSKKCSKTLQMLSVSKGIYMVQTIRRNIHLEFYTIADIKVAREEYFFIMKLII